MPLTSPLPDTFGAALRFLRKRARLTQDELGRAVGYSREQIARLENSSRLPDLAVIAALFVPALLLEQERALVEQFLSLAGQTRHDQQLTITHTKQTRIQLVRETISTPPHTPPAPLLPLLGRLAELDDLLARLPSARLITIIGAPGIGKTRLALELAHAALSHFADGVVFISLAEVTTTADIPYTVLHHLALTPAPQQSPAAAILAYLIPRQLLLVMDNCEHLVEGTGLFADWLARAPHLKLLCTSRVPLDLYGEHEWPLAPLAVPDLTEPANQERWAQFPAMQLLLARAQASNPTFAITDDNLLPLATLCVALDGLPLALELAAVRLRDLSPALLVQQLLTLRGHGQLSSTWLQQTRRNIAERHRTLQAAISWSVNLLTPTAQSSFDRLGLFVGGCTAEAAQDVALADPPLLAQLARANLIQIENGRAHLLETLRSFALEQLTTADQLLACQQAHAGYYARFAQQVFTGLRGDEQTVWMQRTLADHDNCLAAVRWALAQEDGDTAVAIAGGLWWFWTRRGLFALGRELLTAALQLPSTDLPIRAAALNGLASFCLADDDYAANFAYHEQGLALRRQLNDVNGIATVLHNMGLTAFIMGDYAQALAWLAESVTTDPEDPTSAWAHMGLIAQETQDLVQARHWLELAYAQVMAGADGWIQAFVMNFLADV
jgi:predicted ATPase/DNA-binding XRE family transcriptional regulator